MNSDQKIDSRDLQTQHARPVVENEKRLRALATQLLEEEAMKAGPDGTREERK